MFSSRLFWRVFLTHTLLTLTMAGTLVAVLCERHRNEAMDHVRRRLHDSATILQEYVRPILQHGSTANIQDRLVELGDQNQLRLTVIDAAGVVIGDSDEHPAEMDNHGNRPEIRAADESGSGTSERRSPTLGIPMVYYALRVDGLDTPAAADSRLGFVRVSMPTSFINEEIGAFQRLIWGTASTIVLVGLLVTSVIVQRVVRPIMAMTAGAEAIAAGQRAQHVEVVGTDELATLAMAFNSMNRELNERIEQLKAKQEELTSSSHLFETVLGSMVEGVLVVDGAQRILFANDAAEKLLGVRVSDSAGHGLWEVARHPTLDHVFDALLNQDAAEHSVEFEILRTKSIVALTGTRLPGDPAPGCVLVMHNVSELRRLENLRRDFVSNVSHELKTPLTAIQAYAETLLGGAVDDAEINRKFVREIEKQAERLHAQIIDLMAIARIEAGKTAFDVCPVSLRDIGHDCLDAHLAVGEKKSVDLRFEDAAEDVAVLADADELRTLFDNLVDNAIKYTPAGGVVTLRLRTADGIVHFEVTDTGIGIPAEHHARIFERFYRVDKARSRELGGTGLGLAIVKHLASEFGGTVSVSSEPGIGSTFTVTLPRYKPAE